MKKELSNQTFEGDSVPKLTRIIYPWSGIFRDACYTLIGTFLMQYAVTAGVLSSDAATFKSQYAVITIAMMIALLWDGINDPIMGFIIEKVHFRSGKFRPWIGIGAIGNAVVVASMFLFPLLMVGGSGWGYVAFMIVMYVLWDTAFTMNDIGYWSMLPSLTNDPKIRGRLTTDVAVAASVGTALITLVMYILPGAAWLHASTAGIYAISGSVVALLFLISQLAIYFLCKEKKRDAKQEEASEKSSLLDLFRIVAKNRQLLVVVIALLLFQFSEFILTGIGQNYFYMVFGYGGSKGGLVTTGILVIYILATIISQLFYPLLRKKLTNKQILTITGIIVVAGYLAFFFVAFPIFRDTPLAWNTPSDNMFWILGGSMWMYYVFAFLFFGASGIFYLAILVLFQNAIDYQEWKFGERKESIAFAWRPLDVKLASGLNRGLQYLTYLITGTTLFINTISNAEGDYNANLASGMDVAVATKMRDSSIEAVRSDISRGALVGFGAIIIGVIIACALGAYFLIMFGYKIDEKKEEEIVAELAKRHKEAENPSQDTENPENQDVVLL